MSFTTLLQQAKAQEEAKGLPLENGTYKGYVKAAGLSRTKNGWEIAKFTLEILEPVKWKGKLVDKNFLIDENFSGNKQAILIGVGQLSKLMKSEFKKSFNDKRELMNALFDVAEAQPIMEITNIKREDKGKFYDNLTLTTWHSLSKVNVEMLEDLQQLPEVQTTHSAPQVQRANDDIFDPFEPVIIPAKKEL